MTVHWCKSAKKAERTLAALPQPEGENAYALYSDRGTPGVFELCEMYGLHQNMGPWGWDYCERCLIFFPEMIRDPATGMDFCEQCLSLRSA